MKRMYVFPNISFSNQTISNSFRKEPFVFVDSGLSIEQDHAMTRDRYNYRSISSYKNRCASQQYKRSLNKESGMNTKNDMGNIRKSNVKYLSLFYDGNKDVHRSINNGGGSRNSNNNSNSNSSNINSGYVIKTKYLKYLNEELNKKYIPNYKSYNKLYDAMKQFRRKKYDPTNV